MQTITSLWNGTAESLEELSVLCQTEPRKTFDLNLAAPKLRRIVLVEAAYLPYRMNLAYHFPALERIVLEGFALESLMGPDQQCKDVIDLLVPLPHLRSLDLRFLQHGTAIPPQYQFDRVLLADLESISFKFLHPDDVSEFMSVFYAPRLASMHYTMPNTEDPYRIPLVFDHTRYFPQLHTLIVECDHRNELKVDSSFALFLHGFNHVEFVDFTSGEFASLVGLAGGSVSMGDWSASTSPPVSLEIQYTPVTGVIVKSLRQVIETRRVASLPDPTDPEMELAPALEELHVCTQERISDEDRSWFEENIRTFTWLETGSNKEKAGENWTPGSGWMRMTFAPCEDLHFRLVQ
ncbi:hypothetical protein SCP_0600560 [Sparassis crispa]|uniref:F-box domain-containing protein n=1 Tax=Sparassis crispa TaxID=139825 RepID=A0A401GPD5_9APHY|nr:hypothetical protein SCP_0600560 [Sparassis crispa]GBE84078.1 hypothetical protein SCP_0600560 [Sparassis crispa]